MKPARDKDQNLAIYEALLNEAEEFAASPYLQLWEPPSDQEWETQKAEFAEAGIDISDMPKPDYPDNVLYRRSGRYYSDTAWALEDYINRANEQGFDADIDPNSHQCQILFQGALEFPDPMVQALADKVAGHILTCDPLSTGKWMGKYLAAKQTGQLPRPPRGKRPARTPYEIFRMRQFIDAFDGRGLPKKKSTSDSDRYDLIDLLIAVWPTFAINERHTIEHDRARKFVINNCVDRKPALPMI